MNVITNFRPSETLEFQASANVELDFLLSQRAARIVTAPNPKSRGVFPPLNNCWPARGSRSVMCAVSATSGDSTTSRVSPAHHRIRTVSKPHLFHLFGLSVERRAD